MSKYWSRPKHVSSWRKISVGMWGSPRHPAISGTELYDLTTLLDYLEQISEISGEKITLTAYMAKVMATIYEKYPEINTIIINNRVLQRHTIDILVPVAMTEGSHDKADLSAVQLKNCNELDLVQIAKKLTRRATRIRKGKDKELEQTKSMIDKVPPLLIPYMVKLVDFMTHNVPFNLKAIGFRDNPFGTATVSNVGHFGIVQGFGALAPNMRSHYFVVLGSIEDYPFAIDGNVEVRKGAYISYTIDHRCYDGYQIGLITRSIRDMIAHPTKYFPAPDYWQKEDVQAPRNIANGQVHNGADSEYNYELN